MRTPILAAAAIMLCLGPVGAQEKVLAPKNITVRPGARTLSPAQVDACLAIARAISELTDRASVANARGDTDTFNATVDPYNSSTRRWNSECLTPYSPGDMIRAENRMGERLCKFTRTPCMSEVERAAIIARERAHQNRTVPEAAPRARITRSTAVAPRPASPASALAGNAHHADVPIPGVYTSPDQSVDGVEANRPGALRSTSSVKPTVDLDAEAAWVINQRAETAALAAVRSRYGNAAALDGMLDQAAAYQNDCFAIQVQQLVRASLPASQPEAVGIVSSRIVSAAEAGLEEAMATVCRGDVRSGHVDAAADNTCYDATREGFIHAYRRRQQLGPR